MEISVKIEDVQNFTQKYRNYKLNQIEGGKSDYEMEVFRNIMEQSGTMISDLSPYDNVVVSSTNGIVSGNTTESEIIGDGDEFDYDLFN